MIPSKADGKRKESKTSRANSLNRRRRKGKCSELNDRRGKKAKRSSSPTQARSIPPRRERIRTPCGNLEGAPPNLDLDHRKRSRAREGKAKKPGEQCCENFRHDGGNQTIIGNEILLGKKKTSDQHCRQRGRSGWWQTFGRHRKGHLGGEGHVQLFAS